MGGAHGDATLKRKMTMGSAEATALVIRVRLPGPLEALRRRGVPEASIGLPAHVTLLYPFARASELEARLDAIADVAGRHATFDFRLVARRAWPTALYAAIEPEDPFRSLQHDLAGAFPEFPLYGGGIPFVPHVTIAAAAGPGESGLAGDPAWRLLPVDGRATAVDLLALDRKRWRIGQRFPLRTG